LFSLIPVALVYWRLNHREQNIFPVARKLFFLWLVGLGDFLVLMDLQARTRGFP